MKCLIILFSFVTISLTSNDFFSQLKPKSQIDLKSIPQVKTERDKELVAVMFLRTDKSKKYLEEHKQEVYQFVLKNFKTGQLLLRYSAVYKTILESIITLDTFNPHNQIFYILHDYALSIQQQSRYMRDEILKILYHYGVSNGAQYTVPAKVPYGYPFQ